jgi:hypothetical protein
MNERRKSMKRQAIVPLGFISRYACSGQLARVQKEWPGGVPISTETVRRAAKLDIDLPYFLHYCMDSVRHRAMTSGRKYRQALVARGKQIGRARRRLELLCREARESLDDDLRKLTGSSRRALARRSNRIKKFEYEGTLFHEKYWASIRRSDAKFLDSVALIVVRAFKKFWLSRNKRKEKV